MMRGYPGVYIGVHVRSWPFADGAINSLDNLCATTW